MKQRGDQRIDSLYELPLGEFTRARNALAAELKKSGERDEAERIRSLAKPVLTAWVVNRLYRTERKKFDRLAAAGAELRAVQHRGAGDADVLRGAMDRRRAALNALLAAAEKLVVEGGGAATRATLRRIETNLDAVATFGDAGPGQTLGCMTADLDSPGFDALLALAAAAPSRGSTRAARAPAKPLVDPRVVARARTAFDRARRDCERKQTDAERADGVRRSVEERLEETVELEKAARRGLLMAKDRNRRAGKELQRAAARAEAAAAAHARARKALEAAEAALKKASRPRRR